MKWQRARILPPTEPGRFVGVEVGQLLWVRCEPPHVIASKAPLTGTIGRPVPMYDTSVRCTDPQNPRGCYGIRVDQVELMPEFSDADNPDEEQRQ